MVRPCTIIYLPTYLLIIETKHNLHARKKHCLSLSLYIFIYVQDMINFFAKDHAQCFHRAAAGGCGTKLRIVVAKGCEARPYYDDIPMCRGREGGDFGTWRC